MRKTKLEEAESFDYDTQVRQAIDACRAEPGFGEADELRRLELLRRHVAQAGLTSDEFSFIGREVGVFPPLDPSSFPCSI